MDLVISTRIHSDESGMSILHGNLLVVCHAVACLPLSELSRVLRLVNKLVM
jgi:hypothetical protein